MGKVRGRAFWVGQWLAEVRTQAVGGGRRSWLSYGFWEPHMSC